MKNKKRKIIICTMALIFSIMSSAAGWGMIGGISQFHIRLMVGFCFNVTPTMVIFMIIEMFTHKG